MIRKFISSSQYYLYSAYLPTLISLFTLPFITPYLSLRDYGIYGLLFSVYSFLSLILNLGFAVEYQNSFFNDKDCYSEKWSRIFGFQVVWNLFTVIPLGILLLLFTYNQMSDREMLVVIISMLIPYLILDPLKTIGSKHLQYTNKHRRLFAITSVSTFAQYGLVLLLIINFKLGFMAWFLGSLLSSTITAVIFYHYLHTHKIRIDFNFSLADFKRRIKTQTAIILHNLSGYILETSDKVLLALYKVPIEQIGAFNIAYNYTNYGQSVNGALNTVFSPMYFSAINDKTQQKLRRKQVSILFRFWLSLVLFIAINMIIWADYLFSFLYRNQTLNGVYIYAFPMILALLYRPFYVMVVDNLIIQEKTKQIVFISMSGALLNLILNLIFIPFYGIIATVYTTAIAYIFLGFVGLVLPMIRKELTHIYFKSYLPVLLLLIVGLVSIQFLDVGNLSNKIILFLGSFLILLFSNRKHLESFIRTRIFLKTP